MSKANQEESSEIEEALQTPEQRVGVSFSQALSLIGVKTWGFIKLVGYHIKDEIFENIPRMVALVLLVFIVFLGSRINWTKYLNPVRPQTFILQTEPYHIGDVEYVLIYTPDNSTPQVTSFAHPAPQPNPFRAEFELIGVPNEATLFLFARGVDPDEMSSPTEIRINGSLITYLNRKFTQESMDPQLVSIELKTPKKYFKDGSNTLTIYVVPDKEEYGALNIDDIEFWDVRLDVK